MLRIVVAILLQASGAPDLTFSPDQVQSWSKFESADRILDPDQARGVLDGEFRQAGMFGFYSGRWWQPAEPAAEMLCRRLTYFASLRPVDVRDPNSSLRADRQTFVQLTSTYPEPATHETCTHKTGWISATPEILDAKVVGLTRLIEAIDAASRDRTLPFEISCESTSVRPCGDARAALSALYLPTLYEVQPVTDQYRSDPIVDGVRVRYAIRPADGVYNAYEASFGPHDTMDTWYVKLEGRDRLERVTLRRATVIYH